jgi:hypothetical protein
MPITRAGNAFYKTLCHRVVIFVPSLILQTLFDYPQRAKYSIGIVHQEIGYNRQHLQIIPHHLVIDLRNVGDSQFAYQHGWRPYE